MHACRFSRPLCNDEGCSCIHSLMKLCLARGQHASSTTSLRVGLNNQAKDFECVRMGRS